MMHNSPANEILYGGAAGPGKSHALRYEALKWSQKIKGLQIYLFRRTFPELEKNHILPSLDQFPRDLGKYREQKRRWEFKNGSMIHFCHCQYEKDVFVYQGAEIHILLIDELTTFTEFIYDYLRARVRCTKPVPAEYAHKVPGIVCASNPGGVGHEFVKRRWVDFCRLTASEAQAARDRGQFVHHIDKSNGDRDEFGMSKASKAEGGMLRTYIPGKLQDNPILMTLDPGYINRVKGLPEPYRTAYLEGDWDIFIGQMFAFNRDQHVCSPRIIPEYAPLYMTFDWGFGAPFSVGWWWVDADSRVFRCAEWYGWNGTPNQGLRIADSEIAERIYQREIKLGLRNENGMEKRHIIRLAGHDCFQKKPDYKGGGQGPSTAEIFATKGIILAQGDPSRHLKIRQFHERLRVRENELPMVQIYDTCEQFIRTIPLLQADPTDVEDIDTTQEDHVYDEAAHIMMARPISLEIPPPRKTSYEKRIERLLGGEQDAYLREAVADHEMEMARLGAGGVDFGDEDEYDDGDLTATIS
jgi:hypothetical protein